MPSDDAVNQDVDPEVCDEELLAFFAQQAKAMNGRWFYQMSPNEAREASRQLSAWKVGVKRPVGGTMDDVFSFRGESVKLRVYTPSSRGLAPIVVYPH